MAKNWLRHAGWIAVLGFSSAACAQNSPSLADAARQARKDKAQASSGKVFTNDGLPSGAAGGDSVLGGPSSPSSSNVVNFESAQRAIDDADAKIARLASLDRATLVKVALLQVHDADFPGRRAWEDRLWDAKQTYVEQGRECLTQARQLLATAQNLRTSSDGQKPRPDDPKVQEFISQLKQMVQNAVRAEAVFQAVVIEGWDLSKQAAPIAPAAPGSSPQTTKPQE